MRKIVYSETQDMKNFTILACLFTCLHLTCLGQESQSFGIIAGGGVTLLQTDPINYGQEMGVESYTLGAYYSINLFEKFGLEFGLNYQNNALKYKHLPDCPDFGACPFPSTFVTSKFQYSKWSVPLHAKINFTKEIYLNGGILFNWEINEEFEPRLTYGLGLGYDMKLKEKFTLAINPYYNTSSYYNTEISDLSLRLILKRNF
jgi:hypothetical protein